MTFRCAEFCGQTSLRLYSYKRTGEVEAKSNRARKLIRIQLPRIDVWTCRCLCDTALLMGVGYCRLASLTRRKKTTASVQHLTDILKDRFAMWWWMQGRLFARLGCLHCSGVVSSFLIRCFSDISTEIVCAGSLANTAKVRSQQHWCPSSDAWPCWCHAWHGWLAGLAGKL